MTAPTLTDELATALEAVFDAETTQYCHWCQADTISGRPHRPYCPHIPARTALKKYHAAKAEDTGT